MSLDICLRAIRETEVYSLNMTHNLVPMAEEAGIYKEIWRPEELGIRIAGELIERLKVGLEKLEKDPSKYKKLEPPNKWGTYEGLIKIVREYIKACEENPNAKIFVSR